MRYTEIVALKGEQKIIERYMEDGTRFIKNIPFNPSIFIKLKEQFKNKNIFVEQGNNRWIKITKTGENPDLKNAAEKAIGKKEITHDEIVDMESDMLKKAGFIVSVEEKGEDEDAHPTIAT
jgi:hypothetical protein